ncbi:MAG TPA: hypothetical protein VF316_19835, partial [Polyangiaceae bacterium]
LPGGTQDDANLVFGVATTLGRFVVGHSIPQAAAQACNGNNICGTCMRACCGTAQERTPTSGIKTACECGSMPVDQGSCMAQCVDSGEKGTCP